jgi:phage tail-like protein
VAELIPAFRFLVTLRKTRPSAPGPDRLGDGGFAECSGLELEADVREYLEGGRNDGVVRRVGRVKLVPIVLKRGMLGIGKTGYVDTVLWDWLTGMVSGEKPTRYNGSIQVFDRTTQTAVATWTFERGLPSKVVGPSLNARTGDIAMEELHILHEGLRLEVPKK